MQRKRPRISAIKDICTTRSLNHLECKNCIYYDDNGCAEFKEVFKCKPVNYPYNGGWPKKTED